MLHFKRAGPQAVADERHRTAERGVSARHPVRTAVSDESRDRPHDPRSDHRRHAEPEDCGRDAAVHGRRSVEQGAACRAVRVVTRCQGVADPMRAVADSAWQADAGGNI